MPAPLLTPGRCPAPLSSLALRPQSAERLRQGATVLRFRDGKLSPEPSTAHPAGRAVEDQYLVLAQYYGCPVVSMRNALYHHMMADAPGFKGVHGPGSSELVAGRPGHGTVGP